MLRGSGARLRATLYFLGVVGDLIYLNVCVLKLSGLSHAITYNVDLVGVLGIQWSKVSLLHIHIELGRGASFGAMVCVIILWFSVNFNLKPTT